MRWGGWTAHHPEAALCGTLELARALAPRPQQQPRKALLEPGVGAGLTGSPW